MKLLAAAAAAVVASLVACGSPQPTPPPIGNTGTGTAAAPTAGIVSGTLYDEAGQPLIGATLVVVVDGDPPEDLIRISDDSGRYAFGAPLDPGPHKLRIYYADTTTERSFDVDGATQVDQHLSTQSTNGDIVYCTEAALASCH